MGRTSYFYRFPQSHGGKKKEKVVYVHEGSGASGFPSGSWERPWVPLPHERTHSYESLYYKVMV